MCTVLSTQLQLTQYTTPLYLHGTVHRQRNNLIFFDSLHETECVRFDAMTKIKQKESDLYERHHHTL